MNIVILDGKLLNPGDVDWGPIEALGNLKVHSFRLPNNFAVRAISQ